MTIAVITGGAGGIGLGVAWALAQRGTHLVIADIDGAVAHEGAPSMSGAHEAEAEAHEST
jgi:3-hydroxybutyrate dehydrogenase